MGTVMADFLSKACSVTRFKVREEVTNEQLLAVPERLRQFAFVDIDNVPEVQAYGWVNFDDMLDAEWRVSPPEKGLYLTFALRIDTRRISPAVLKKHYREALEEEKKRLQAINNTFISRERRKEIKDQVKLRLLNRAMPIPETHQVIWDPGKGIVMVSTASGKVLDIFLTLFVRSFDVSLDQLEPREFAAFLLQEHDQQKVDMLEPAQFVANNEHSSSLADFLGKDFLTWLWWRSEVSPEFQTIKGEIFTLSMEQRVTVSGGDGITQEIASVSGPLSGLREARVGLANGKKVTQCTLSCEKDGLSWQTSFNAMDLSARSLRCPRIENEGDDPDGVVLEKIYLMEVFFSMVDALYNTFLVYRLSEEVWTDQVENVQCWILECGTSTGTA